MKKKIFSLLALIVATVMGAWADDITIKTLDWSASEWSSKQAICTGELSETVNGITFTRTTNDENKEYFIDNGILTFTADGNFDPKGRYLAIPLSNVNGQITINIAAVAGKQLYVRYAFVGGSDTKGFSAYNTSTKTSSGDPLSFTVSDIEDKTGVLYIGRAGSNQTQIGAITITTPSSDDNTDNPGTEEEQPTIKDSDLSLQSSTKTINVGDEWTLAKDVDFTGSGVVTISSSSKYIKVSGLKVTAFSQGTATLTVEQAATETMYKGTKTITITVKRDNEDIIDAAKTWDFTSMTTSDNVGVMEGIYYDVTSGVINDVNNAGTTKENNVYVGLVGLKINSTTKTYFNIPEGTAGTVTVEFAARYQNQTPSLKMNGVDSKNPTDGKAVWTVEAGTSQIVFERGTETKEGVIQRIIWTPDPTSLTLPLNETGFATLSLPFAWTVDAAHDAYVVKSSATEGYVSLEQVTTGTTVAAGTGMVIVFDPQALNVGVFEASTEEGSVIEGNLLKGNLDERMTGDVGTFYVLTKIAQSEVGFRLNGADTGVRQYGAYIPVLSGIASAVLRFEGDASGIFCIENDVDGQNAYDLMGRQLQSGRKGLSIVNGQVIFSK